MAGDNRSVKTMRIRPTSAAAAEPMDDPHYLPADPADLLRANPVRRVPVWFTSAGTGIAGHLYRPPDAPPDRRTAGIVMCGPFSSVKEQTVLIWLSPNATKYGVPRKPIKITPRRPTGRVS